MKRFFTPALAVLLLLAVGCSTSTAFKAGAAVLVPRVTTRHAAYLEKDTTSGADLKAARIADNAELRNAVADKANITLENVEGGWAKVKPAYLSELAAAISDPEVRAVFVDTTVLLDNLIAAEHARRTAWFPFGASP